MEAKIADFGLGQVTPAGAGAPASLASQFALVGTKMYLPPEAEDPFAPRKPPQDDVFAVGVLWYQLAVERLERPPYDYADRLKEAGIDTHTIRLISRCLAHPQRRFADACALEDAFDTLGEDWPVPAGCFDVQYLAREYLSSSEAH